MGRTYRLKENEETYLPEPYLGPNSNMDIQSFYDSYETIQNLDTVYLVILRNYC